jgi:hypothetical protein
MVLRLGTDELQVLIADNRKAAAERRTAFLAEHADWIECVVEGCDGLVSPRFVRTAADGSQYGFCPRRQRHLQVAPAAFAR